MRQHELLADRSRMAQPQLQLNPNMTSNNQQFSTSKSQILRPKGWWSNIRPMLILREVTDINGQIQICNRFFQRRHTIHSHAQQLPEHSCVEIAAELESETVHMQCAHVDNTTHSYTVNYAHQIKLCDKLGLMKPDAVSCCSSGWSIKCSNW